MSFERQRDVLNCSSVKSLAEKKPGMVAFDNTAALSSVVTMFFKEHNVTLKKKKKNLAGKIFMAAQL